MKLSNCISFPLCHSPEETIDLATQFAIQLQPNDIVALSGDLGAGKTTFVKGVAQGLGSSDLVQSPTYVYLQIYEAPLPLFHFDLYRLRSSDDFLAMGFEEHFSQGGITLIEWPERLGGLLPPQTIHLRIQTLSETTRFISCGPWSAP